MAEPKKSNTRFKGLFKTSLLCRFPYKFVWQSGNNYKEVYKCPGVNRMGLSYRFSHMTHIDKTPYRYDLLLMVQDGSFNARASPLHNYNPHLHTPHGKDLETAGSGLPAIAAIAGFGIPNNGWLGIPRHSWFGTSRHSGNSRFCKWGVPLLAAGHISCSIN